MLWSWNLHLGWPLIKEADWWRHHPCHVTHVYFTDQRPFLLASAKMIDDVINQLRWRRRPRGSFNLIAYLEPVKQDDHYFHAEILVCKFHLVSRVQRYLKKPPGRKRGCKPPLKKISDVLTRLWMHVVHLEFSSTLKSCSCCTHGCFMPLILYLI